MDWGLSLTGAAYPPQRATKSQPWGGGMGRIHSTVSSEEVRNWGREEQCHKSINSVISVKQMNRLFFFPVFQRHLKVLEGIWLWYINFLSPATQQKSWQCLLFCTYRSECLIDKMARISPLLLSSLKEMGKFQSILSKIPQLSKNYHLPKLDSYFHN